MPLSQETEEWLGKNLRTLKDIRLGRTEISDEGLQHPARLIKLRTVELGQTRITGSGLHHLPVSVTTLWLPLSQVNDGGLKRICSLEKS